MMKGGRRKRTAAGTVAVLSAVCAALLWAGVSSFSHAQLPTGTGSNSTRRTSEGVAPGGVSATAAGKTQQEAPPVSPRKLTRRPELKTRGGQLAFAPFSLLAEYPHDNTAFTQGLSFDGGFLYESTGLFGGKSTVRKVEPETGKVLQSVSLGDKHFGEGMVILNNEIHSLTWRSHVGFTWDLETFKKKKEFNFDTKTGQGWGITTDGESLIVSDGSEFLFFWDPETMKETRRVKVKRQDGRPLIRINELEMVKGFVFANVWFDDHLYKIDPVTGIVVDAYSFSELYPKALQKIELTSKEAVLNGIAWDPVEDVLYLTGKLWPRVYKVKILDEDAQDQEQGPEEVMTSGSGSTSSGNSGGLKIVGGNERRQ